MSTGGPSGELRTVVEAPSFSECVRALAWSVRRLDEVLEDLEWRLAHDPLLYSFRVGERRTRLTFQDAPEGTLRVIFHLDRDSVVLTWIEMADQTPPLVDDFPY